MRITTTAFFIMLSIPLWGQNWVTLKPELYPAAKMAAEGVEMVNVYEVVKGKVDEGKEHGHVVRVVRSPVRSYSFDRKGNRTEHIEYNEETGQVRMRAEMRYGENGIAFKESKVYVTRADAKVNVNDSLNHGMKLAIHREIKFDYDEHGHLAKRVLSEIGGGKSMVVDSTTFEFKPDGRLSNSITHRAGSDVRDASIFSYGENGEVSISGRNGGETIVQLDEQGRFSSIREFPYRNVRSGSEEFFFYRGSQLDSTTATYKSPTAHTGEGLSISRSYFYDKSGKLVMIREHLADGSVMEILHEYFYFHEHE